MTAKEYLQNIKLMDIKIQQLKKEYEDLYRTRDSIPGIDYSADRVQTSPNGQGFTKAVEELCDLEYDINIKINKFRRYKYECIRQIQDVTKPEFMTILFKRYVEYKTFEQIACEMNFSYAYICELHGQALKEFDSIRLSEEPN